MSSAKKPKKQTSDLEKFPYAGWVPTVNGRLSFRHIGDSQHPTESINVNISNSDFRVTAGERIVLAYQRRPFRDILFPWITERVLGIGDTFWFALAIRSVESPHLADELCGEVYIYKQKKDWREKAEPFVRPNIREIEDLRFSANKNRWEQIGAKYESAKAYLESTFDIKVSFRLKRTGEIFFSQPQFMDTRLQAESRIFAEETGHDFFKSVADQAYFYIRDISHAHQHHHPAADTILILQKRDAEDVEWRKKVIYSLYYSIIRFKRGSSDELASIRSTGLHAYCLSFKSICQQAVGEAKYEKFPIFNDNALVQSLKSKSEEIIADAALRVSRGTTARTIQLTLLAILIAILAIFVQPRIGGTTAGVPTANGIKPDKETFPDLHAFSDLVTTYFFHILIAFAASYFLVWLSTTRWPRVAKLFNSVLEAANHYRWPSIVVLSALSSAIVYSAYKVFLPASRGYIELIGRALRILVE